MASHLIYNGDHSFHFIIILYSQSTFSYPISANIFFEVCQVHSRAAAVLTINNQESQREVCYPSSHKQVFKPYPSGKSEQMWGKVEIRASCYLHFFFKKSLFCLIIINGLWDEQYFPDAPCAQPVHMANIYLYEARISISKAKRILTVKRQKEN